MLIGENHSAILQPVDLLIYRESALFKSHTAPLPLNSSQRNNQPRRVRSAILRFARGAAGIVDRTFSVKVAQSHLIFLCLMLLSERDGNSRSGPERRGRQWKNCVRHSRGQIPARATRRATIFSGGGGRAAFEPVRRADLRAIWSTGSLCSRGRGCRPKGSGPPSPSANARPCATSARNGASRSLRKRRRTWTASAGSWACRCPARPAGSNEAAGSSLKRSEM